MIGKIRLIWENEQHRLVWEWNSKAEGSPFRLPFNFRFLLKERISFHIEERQGHDNETRTHKLIYTDTFDSWKDLEMKT